MQMTSPTADNWKSVLSDVLSGNGTWSGVARGLGRRSPSWESADKHLQRHIIPFMNNHYSNAGKSGLALKLAVDRVHVALGEELHARSIRVPDAVWVLMLKSDADKAKRGGGPVVPRVMNGTVTISCGGTGTPTRLTLSPNAPCSPPRSRLHCSPLKDVPPLPLSVTPTSFRTCTPPLLSRGDEQQATRSPYSSTELGASALGALPGMTATASPHFSTESPALPDPVPEEVASPPPVALPRPGHLVAESRAPGEEDNGAPGPAHAAQANNAPTAPSAACSLAGRIGMSLKAPDLSRADDPFDPFRFFNALSGPRRTLEEHSFELRRLDGSRTKLMAQRLHAASSGDHILTAAIMRTIRDVDAQSDTVLADIGAAVTEVRQEISVQLEAQSAAAEAERQVAEALANAKREKKQLELAELQERLASLARAINKRE